MDDSAGSQNWLPDRMEQRDKESRQRMWAWAFLAFALGVFIGGLIVFAVLDRGVHQMADSVDRSIASLKSANAAWEKAARDCNAQFTTATLLVEEKKLTQDDWVDVPGITSNPLASFLQSLNRQSPNHVMSVEGWYIPAKITPVAYGKGERRYWWFDPKEKKLDGPYIPLRNTGPVQ